MRPRPTFLARCAVDDPVDGAPISPVRLIATQEAVEMVVNPGRIVWWLGLTGGLTIISLALILDGSGSFPNARAAIIVLMLATVLGALFATIAGIDAIGGGRERGSIMPLLLAPVSPRQIVLGKLAGPLAASAVMLMPAAASLAMLGNTDPNLASGGVALVLVGTPIVTGFGFLALGLGARIRSRRGAFALSIGILVLLAGPLVWSKGFGSLAIEDALNATNPLLSALVIYDTVVARSQTQPQQLANTLPILVWFFATFRFALTSDRSLSWPALSASRCRVSPSTVRARGWRQL